MSNVMIIPKKTMQTLLWIVLGLVVIYLFLCKAGIIPEYLFVTAILTVVFSYVAVAYILKLSFSVGLLAFGILMCIHDKTLGISSLSPLIFIIASLLLGIILDMLFKELRKKRRNVEYLRVENYFGSINRYVNSDCFRGAYIENSFGVSNIYFEDVAPADNHAAITAMNSFGKLALYLPKNWRIEYNDNSELGGVIFHGKGSEDSNAPVADLNFTCTFGQIDVYFET